MHGINLELDILLYEESKGGGPQQASKIKTSAAELNAKDNDTKTLDDRIDHVTAQLRKMAAALGDVNMLNKLHADFRANELFHH